MIAVFSLAAILLYLVLRFGYHAHPVTQQMPLMLALGLGGIPLISELVKRLIGREVGADVLAGISIIASALLGEYLAGAIIILMLSGGAALEAYAVRSASSVLCALSKCVPSVAHRKQGSAIVDIALADVAVGDLLIVFPHEVCPVDGLVVEGHGVMDESFLTGEPFRMSKIRPVR